MPSCNQCGREVQEKDIFCPFCGVKMGRNTPQQPIPPKEEGLYCTYCGKVNKPNFQFCLHCGQKLKKPTTSESPPQTTKINQNGSDKSMIYCGNCGESMKPNALFCIHCGYKKPNTQSQQKSEIDAQTVIVSHNPTETPVNLNQSTVKLPPVNPQFVTNPSLPPTPIPIETNPIPSQLLKNSEIQFNSKPTTPIEIKVPDNTTKTFDSEMIRKITKDTVLSEEVLSLLEARLNNNLLSQVQEQLVSQLKPEIEMKLRGELESQIRKELVTELTPEIAEAIRKELEIQIREEYTPIYREALEKQLSPEIEKNLEAKLTPDLRNRIYNHLTPVIQREIREKELLDIRRKLEGQLRPVIQQELMVEMEKKQIIEEQQKLKSIQSSQKVMENSELPQFQPFPNPFQRKMEPESKLPVQNESVIPIESPEEPSVESEVVEEISEDTLEEEKKQKQKLKAI